MIAIRQSLLGLRLTSRHVASYRNIVIPYTVTKIAHKYQNKHYRPSVSFGISTIVLGVQNTNLRSQIDELESDKTTTPETVETTTMTTETPTTETPDLSKYRLPTTVKPFLYDLYLYPDLDTGLFKGKVIVSLQVLAETDSIVLHSNLLTIDAAKVDSVAGKFTLDETYEILTIVKEDSSNFAVGNRTLEIEFNGDMKNRIVGLYTSSYTTESGETRQIATSKFEPTYARQAFPCFDEPNMKSKYIVHLLKPKSDSYIALSNYPVSATEDYDDTHQLVTFDETVSMSTYLSCFIVSDFTHTETSFDNKGSSVPLKVYASPDNLNKTSYAGEVGKKTIEYYVEYFNIAYPLPKLDMVAIPDFVSGAMEHWGLVTYRETALLYTDTTHSTANKQRVASVIAHELAHSWFGNLVTMDWWNDLWLNEGFASYIEYKGVLAAEPTWGMLEQFLTSELHPVLSLDATLSSHPIVQTVLTPDQITEIFDTISYNKGASILRMLESMVGETNFQTGVTNYLNKYAFSNAITDNFLNEIQSVVGDTLDVAEMMDTFTLQMGYPILTATVDGDNYIFTQTRFLKDPSATYDPTESEYGYKWTIPITYVTNLGKSSDLVLFKYNVNQITIPKPEGATWIKFNYDQVGYYRVNYPEAQWRELGDNFTSLSVSDRTHLLEESFSIAEAGQLSYQIPLELTKNLITEIDYTPWSVASSKLQAILTYLTGSGSTQEASFKAYINSIVTPAYDILTWTETEGDGHLRRLTRVDILNLACEVGHTDCLAEAQSRFNNWIQTKEALSQDLRSLIYKYGGRTANESTWEQLLEAYKSESDATEKLKLFNGLANVQDVTILSNLIELTKNESIVRSQDYFSVMQYISGNRAGTSLVWNWVRENWEYLVERFTLNNRYLGSLIPAITKTFATQERLTEMQEFFAKYPNAGAGTANRATALETVQNNIRWLANHRVIVEDWIVNATSTRNTN